MNFLKSSFVFSHIRQLPNKHLLSYFPKSSSSADVAMGLSNVLILRYMAQKNPNLAIPALNLLSPDDPATAFLENFSCSSFIQNERPFTPPPLNSPSSSPPSSPSPSSPSGHLDEIKIILRKCVSEKNRHDGTSSIDNNVKELCHLYSLLTSQEKSAFVIHLASTLSIKHNAVVELVKQMPEIEKKSCPANSLEIEAFVRWQDKLCQSLQPPYHWLAMQISRLDGGVKFLVDLRENLLGALSDPSLQREDQTSLKALDGTLRDLLSLWFTVGLLELERITWESSCLILQKISDYEAVHPVRNWTDLRRRVGKYRRCFIFTHSCMPKEPLVVLHTFLTDSISSSMSNIVRSHSFDGSTAVLGDEESSSIKCAIFYSITSTQKGLKGIELGNYLIKRVVKELQAEFPHISQFSSLSPIPGFLKWLEGELVKARRGEINLLLPNEIESLQNEMEVVTFPDVYAELQRLLKSNAWMKDEVLFKILEEPLMRLCAYYLFIVKRRSFAFDSVANFHLRNGAVMWRINWDADRSPRGLRNSCGIMVNYRYFLEDCENNSKSYFENCKITASEDIMNRAISAQEIIEPSKSKM